MDRCGKILGDCFVSNGPKFKKKLWWEFYSSISLLLIENVIMPTFKSLIFCMYSTNHVYLHRPNAGGRRSPAVACWASDHWVASSNPLRGKFRH